MAEYNEIVNVIVRWSEQGKEVAESIKKSLAGSKKDMAEWTASGQKVAKKQVEAFETAGDGLRKITKSYAVPMGQAGKLIESGMIQIGETSKTISPQMKMVTADLEQTRDATTKTMTTFRKVGEGWVKTGQTIIKSARPFRMEYLSIMFLGMAIKRTFQGMIMPVLQLAGVFDIFQGVLTAILLPVLMPFIQMFINFATWLMSSPKWVRDLVGILIILGFVFGSLLTIIGMFSIVDIAKTMNTGIKAAIEWAGKLGDKLTEIASKAYKIVVSFLEDAKNTLLSILTKVFPGFTAGQAALTIAISFAIGATVATLFWDWVKTNLTDKFGPRIGTALSAALVVGAAVALAIIGAALAATVVGAPIGVPLIIAAGALGAIGAGLTIAMKEMQYGGIVTRPTAAILGEHGKKEAVIPLEEGGFASTINVGTINLNTTLSSNNIGEVVNELLDRLSGEMGRLRMGR